MIATIGWSTWIAGATAALLLWICVVIVRSASLKAIRPAQASGLVALAILLLCLAMGAASLRRFFAPSPTVEAGPVDVKKAPTERSSRTAELKARAAELRSRAMMPGSALACLDLISDRSIEAACEASLFANPQTVASALAYTDARFSLLADSAKFASSELNKEPAFEWLLRTLELDRFGFVAHLLEMNGCSATNCYRLLLLRDARNVAENLRARTFDELVATHAQNWRRDSAKEVAAPTVPDPPQMAPVPKKAARTAEPFDYPTPALFPPVSIMKPEPMLPANLDPATAAASAPGIKMDPVRRQPAREQPKDQPLQLAPAATTIPAPKSSAAEPEDEQKLPAGRPVDLHNLHRSE